MKQLFKDIPGSTEWQVIEPIANGWSNDEKYYVEKKSGEKLLLRISDKESLEEEKDAYNAIRKLAFKEINITNLLGEGLCNLDRQTYRLFTWLEGEEARKSIPLMTPKEQYETGIKAGSILHIIHKLPYQKSSQEWANHFNQKIDRNIFKYKNCGYAFSNLDKVISFLEKHRYLLDERPQCFQHGDFHIGNMIIHPTKGIGIIDFNRHDYGDPWEEFNRMPWNAMVSTSFANGIIHGYFNDIIPEEFFIMMAMYIGSNQLGAMSWAQDYGKTEVEVIRTQTKKVMKWYNDYNRIVPDWYKS